MVPQRKWAKGIRVKPNTGEHGAKGRVNLSRLLSRDPKLRGKDRPEFTPDVVFEHIKDVPKPEPEPEPEPEPVTEPKPKPKVVDTRTEKEKQADIKHIFDLLEDDSTDDDW